MKKTIIAVLVSTLLTTLSGCTFLKVTLMPEVQPLEEQVLSGEGKD